MRAGSVEADADFTVVWVIFGWPGKSTLKPSGMFWYSAQSWAAAALDSASSTTKANEAVRMVPPRIGQILSRLAPGQRADLLRCRLHEQIFLNLGIPEP